MLRAVLFDAGDTLIRLRRSVGDVYARVAAQHGVHVEPNEIEARFRDAFGHAPPLCFPDATSNDIAQREYGWWRDVVCNTFAGIRFADLEAFYRDLFVYFARPESWEIYSDVLPALQDARARGLRLGIVSNFDARLFALCDGLELTKYFDAIVVSGRAGVAKPDPRIFAIAMGRLGVSAPETLHVGDSELDDRQAATQAGLHALRLDRAASGADPGVIVTLLQLKERLDQGLQAVE